MAWTQADLDKLDEDIAALGAVEEYTFEDQTIRARKIEAALKLRATMAHALGVSTARAHRYAATSKGV